MSDDLQIKFLKIERDKLKADNERLRAELRQYKCPECGFEKTGLRRDEGDETECSICCGKFNMETEGGTVGFIGILPVAFCPTCKVGIFDFVEQYPSTEEEASE